MTAKERQRKAILDYLATHKDPSEPLGAALLLDRIGWKGNKTNELRNMEKEGLIEFVYTVNRFDGQWRLVTKKEEVK